MEAWEEIQEKETLYSSLVSFGAVYPLNISFNTQQVEQDLQSYSTHWKHYNPRKPHIPRFGLSLTSLDGTMSGVPDLDSLREYNLENKTSYLESSLRTPTEALKNISSLRLPIEKFLPHLGRSHLLRFNEGGYFPFHRDSPYLGADCFRLIAPLNFCGPIDLCFVHDGHLLHLEHGRLYFLNTRIEHAIFSFTNHSTLLVLNVLLSRESVSLVFANTYTK